MIFVGTAGDDNDNDNNNNNNNNNDMHVQRSILLAASVKDPNTL